MIAKRLPDAETLYVETVRWVCIAGMAFVAIHASSGLDGSSACNGNETVFADDYPIDAGSFLIGPPLCIDGIRTINVIGKD